MSLTKITAVLEQKYSGRIPFCNDQINKTKITENSLYLNLVGQKQVLNALQSLIKTLKKNLADFK